MATAILNAVIVLPVEHGGPRITPLRFELRILSIDQPPEKTDHIFDWSGRMVYPGLINAHDHLELNHFPRTKFRAIYQNAAQWARDFQPYLAREPFLSLRQIPLSQQCWIGGLKNLHSGVTTVAQHNPLYKPLRQHFPVRVVQHYGWAHSLYLAKNVPLAYQQTPAAFPWMIHLAEGTDQAAQAELDQLDRLGCLHDNTVLIHGVGLTEQDSQRVLDAGAGLVWCPSSNEYLLGMAAQVRSFAHAGRLALGTDSRLTADGNMLDELRAAHRTGQLTPEQLFRTVTVDAARLLRLTDVGALLPGYHADFFVTTTAPDPYTALLELTPERIHEIYVAGHKSC